MTPDTRLGADCADAAATLADAAPAWVTDAVLAAYVAAGVHAAPGGADAYAQLCDRIDRPYRAVPGTVQRGPAIEAWPTGAELPELAGDPRPVVGRGCYGQPHRRRDTVLAVAVTVLAVTVGLAGPAIQHAAHADRPVPAVPTIPTNYGALNSAPLPL